VTHEHDNHEDLAAMGRCDQCRAFNVALLSKAPRRFALYFIRPGDDGVEFGPCGNPGCDCTVKGVVVGLAIMPSWRADSRELIEAAWMTGCNLGDEYGVGAMEIPPSMVESWPICQTVQGPGLVSALDQLRAGAKELADNLDLLARGARP
jgi:hypothetical protein